MYIDVSDTVDASEILQHLRFLKNPIKNGKKGPYQLVIAGVLNHLSSTLALPYLTVIPLHCEVRLILMHTKVGSPVGPVG